MLNGAEATKGGTVAPPEIVATWAEAAAIDPPPLVVREGLRRALGGAALPEVRRIDAGHSNATFAVRAGEHRYVLRRPPRPPFEPKAHDVLREHRFLVALRDTPVRAPRPVLACADPAYIGAPFYLMEQLDGVVLREPLPAALAGEEDRRRASLELVDALVELHAIDPGATGLGDAARGGGYVRRQLELWSRQWERNQTRPVPALDEVTRWLHRDVPASPAPTIVHGDYKLDNILFAPAPPARVVAILDWEMATIGDPLADVGYLTATWVDRDEPAGRIGGLSSVTCEPGFARRHDLVERYAARSGRSLDRLAWYQALALWKLAILLEASYGRHLAGTTDDAFFATLETGVPRIAEQALTATAGALL